MLVLGLGALVLVDPPEGDGWLRSAFGTVFGYMAIAMAAVLAVPSVIGLWAMAGANADGAEPALGHPARLVVSIAAVGTVVCAAAVLLVSGRGASILHRVLTAIVALSTLGLAGAAAYSPHRGRAILSAASLLITMVVLAWMLVQMLLAVRG